MRRSIKSDPISIKPQGCCWIIFTRQFGLKFRIRLSNIWVGLWALKVNMQITNSKLQAQQNNLENEFDRFDANDTLSKAIFYPLEFIFIAINVLILQSPSQSNENFTLCSILSIDYTQGSRVLIQSAEGIMDQNQNKHLADHTSETQSQPQESQIPEKQNPHTSEYAPYPKLDPNDVAPPPPQNFGNASMGPSPQSHPAPAEGPAPIAGAAATTMPAESNPYVSPAPVASSSSKSKLRQLQIYASMGLYLTGIELSEVGYFRSFLNKYATSI